MKKTYNEELVLSLLKTRYPSTVWRDLFVTAFALCVLIFSLTTWNWYRNEGPIIRDYLPVEYDLSLRLISIAPKASKESSDILNSKGYLSSNELVTLMKKAKAEITHSSTKHVGKLGHDQR